MRFNWKKTLLLTCDIALGVYLIAAFTAFNKPDESARICTKVNIDIQDEATNVFITTPEIKARLEKLNLYPMSKPLIKVNTRDIEDVLKESSFVRTAQCYKTDDGQVFITLTQRMPTLRIKAANGDDYYLDDNNSIMPNSRYTSDLIVATGNINRWYARNYIAYVGKALMANDFWNRQIVQINVLPNKGVELVPRVGDHIIYIGQLPETKYIADREKLVTKFINKKMHRLEMFYKYGLSHAGWNKYSYIDIEFDNQIICKKRTMN